MEEADKHTIRTLLRRDTSNLMLVTSLAVVVVSRAAQEGWRGGGRRVHDGARGSEVQTG